MLDVVFVAKFDGVKYFNYMSQNNETIILDMFKKGSSLTTGLKASFCFINFFLFLIDFKMTIYVKCNRVMFIKSDICAINLQ